MVSSIQGDPKVPVQEDISKNRSAYINAKYYGFRIFPCLSDGDLYNDLDHDLEGKMRSCSRSWSRSPLDRQGKVLNPEYFVFI